MVSSLQRFQIGETGDGQHIKRFARHHGDPDYEECISLFIKEEQSHAAILAEIIHLLGGKLLTWHWSDMAFVALRRLLGLRTEIVILLCAEVIGKCFYDACAENMPVEQLQHVFASIVEDERGHLKFHWCFIQQEVDRLNRCERKAIYHIWRYCFLALCLVFIADHCQALRALKVSPAAFFHDCAQTFNRAAIRALLL